MQSDASTGHPGLQRPPTPLGEHPWEGFTGFGSLNGNFTMVPNEIWTLPMPGLTPELRWTLVSLTRETVGEAYRRGGSPYDFAPISWSRWMKVLGVKDRNTVRARLARLEEMGLIEVQSGSQGTLGSTANAYRLRWANGGQPAPRTLNAVMQRRQRDIDRKQEGRREEECLAGTQVGAPAHPPLTPPGVSAHPPRRTPPGGVRRTPPGGGTAHPPSVKENKYGKNTEEAPSVSPSVVDVPAPTDGLTDGLTDGSGEPGAPWAPWLKAEEAETGWPEPLLKALEGLLDPPQMPGIAQRSPWSGEGAWAILQAIQVGGRNLNKQVATLWNALMLPEKGAPWLARAGPLLREAGWHMVPEDDTTEADYLRVIRAKRLAEHGYQRLPLYGEALEKHRSLRAAWLRQQFALEEGDPPDEEETTMDHPCAQESPKTADPPPTRPEDLAPEVKAQLRRLIETQRQAFRSACRAPASKRDEHLATSARCWDAIGNLLEPVLPLEVQLPDEYRPRAVRQKGQIKAGVLNAIYDVISGAAEPSAAHVPATNF